MSAFAPTQPFEALIADMDGVLTETARIHEQAWKQIFDQFLEGRSDKVADELHRPFSHDDYRRYVDGKPRYNGVVDFLTSRGIKLPFGAPDDAPGTDTACAIGNRKKQSLP